MEDLGLVSVIMPTYNCGRFISETINSVQAQTYQNWEILIVDDCSTDNTPEVVSELIKHDPRIKYYCLEKNSGAAIARNTALRLARGRWIAFLDSDDLWEPNKLKHQLKFMLENNFAFSYTERDVIDESSLPLGIEVSGPRRITKLKMKCYCWIGCLTAMYDANKIGIIQIRGIKKNNDYAIWLQISEKFDCYLLKEKLAHYRFRKGSISDHHKIALIKWHYKLFRFEQKLSVIESLFWTSINIFCNIIKKTIYMKKV